MIKYLSKVGKEPKKDYDDFLIVCINKLRIKDASTFIDEMDQLVLGINERFYNEDSLTSQLSTVLGKYSTLQDPQEATHEINVLNGLMLENE